MNDRLTDDQLREKALDVLTRHLGLAQTLRFLSWLRSNPGDYQSWRDGRFGDLTADSLIAQMRALEARQAQQQNSAVQDLEDHA